MVGAVREEEIVLSHVLSLLQWRILGSSGLCDTSCSFFQNVLGEFWSSSCSLVAGHWLLYLCAPLFFKVRSPKSPDTFAVTSLELKVYIFSYKVFIV